MLSCSLKLVSDLVVVARWKTPFIMVHRAFPGKAALIFRKKYSLSRKP